MLSEFESFYDMDMLKLGNLFEFVYQKTQVSVYAFIEKFMNSTIREKMEVWHPWFSNEDSGMLWHHLITLEFKETDFGSRRDDEVFYPNQLKWIGEMYGYLHYFTGLSSKELYKQFPLDQMLIMYIPGHEMVYETFALRLEREGVITEWKY